MRNKFFVLDTNVLVSAFLTKQSKSRNAFDKAVESGKIVVSKTTLDKFKEVLFRPKFNKYISAESKIEVFNDFEKLIIIVETSVSITDCRDPKDNKFLELAISANASCLITGDRDLLILNPFRGISVLSPVEFVGKI